MRTLLYHDVVADGQWSASGFPGGDAAIYKLTRDAFFSHLARLHASGHRACLLGDATADRSFVITFDDGGVSAADTIAPALERFGWRGYFFMTTGRIGAPAFLDPRQLRALAGRGHVIGSHSDTHPLRMSSCSPAQLLREWQVSVDRLAEILGERPHTASIPGGAFSAAVARAAGDAGIRVLFTSEPTPQPWKIDDVTCMGRYTVWRGMGPDVAVAFASGTGIEPLRQRLFWDTKKIAKNVFGPAYQRLRERLLSTREPA